MRLELWGPGAPTTTYWVYDRWTHLLSATWVGADGTRGCVGTARPAPGTVLRAGDIVTVAMNPGGALVDVTLGSSGVAFG